MKFDRCKRSGGTGERHKVDVNALVEEYVKCAFHGMMGQDKDAVVTL